MSLVLTITLENGIQIGDDVTVKLVRIRGQQARIAIDCPRAMSISRTGRDGKPMSRHFCKCSPQPAIYDLAKNSCLTCKGKIDIDGKEG